MRQRTFLPANGWLENFFLLLNFTCPKHKKVLQVPTNNLKDLQKSFMGVERAKQPKKTHIMNQKTCLPAKSWSENFFLLLKFTCPKPRTILEVPTNNLKDFLKSFMGKKWAKQPSKRNHEAENFFACHGLVGDLFSVAQIHMSKAQKDIRSAHKQLCRPPEDLGGHKMVKTA